MSAHALHFPERPHVVRWTFASFAILLAHAAFATALLLWYQRTPPEQPLLPAIMVSFAPQAPAALPADEPIVQEHREEQPQVEEPKVEEPKIEEAKIEQPLENVAPPPPRPAVIALPKPEPKRAERKDPKREERKKSAEKKWQPPQEEQEAKVRMPVVARQSRFVASNDYKSLVVGQLQRATRGFPAGAPAGQTSVAFRVNRDGSLLEVHVTKSSGNSILDQTTLDTVRRASPFPRFPPEMPQAQEPFSWGLKFTPPH